MDVPIDTGTTPPGRDEVWVVRVGDGPMPYSSSAAPVFTKTYYGDTGVTSGRDHGTPAGLSGDGVDFTTGTWSQVGPVAGLTASLRGLTGRRDGTRYVFFATTAETRSRLVRIDVEAATLLGIETTLATSPMSTAYRGVAFATR